MDQQVIVPAGFFLKEARHEYYDYRTRLIIELLQNSLDAGATEIKLIVSKAGYSCEDNGLGMSKERMVSALLTMGGSAKEAGATGGFGAAKKLLLFSHESYSIHSNETYVEGKVLSYKFVENVQPRVGTKIEAMFTTDFDADNSLVYLTKAFLKKCNFRGRFVAVYVNDMLFSDYYSPDYSKDVVGLGAIYCSKKRTDNNSVLIRHNGLCMFDRYVSDLRRDVVIEVAGNSVDVFTQNRDGMKGSHREALDKVIAEMTIDKESFTKTKPRKYVVSGIDSFVRHIARQFTITPTIQAAINSVRMNSVAMVLAPVEFARLVANKVNESTGVSDADKETVNNIATYVRKNEANLQTDFHFDLADSTFTKVPDQFIPNTGKKKYTFLAALWKVCVREVLNANDINQSFTIGFTFSSSAIATHQMRNGVSNYLLNPRANVVDNGSLQERVTNILMTAVHEVVHSQGNSYHDESFTCRFHSLLTPTLVKGATWRQLVKLAKQEKV